MSILSRVKISPQQRYDLEDFLAEQSAARTDSKLWTQKFLSENNLILGGFSVSGIGLTQATVAMTGAAFIFPQNTADFSYFVSSAAEPDVVIPDSSLVDGARNYVEAQLTTQDGTPLTKAFWDPEANSGAGQEFNQIVNTITDLKCSFVVSTGGFSGSPDRLPVAIIDCDGSGVIKVILDRRQLYGRLALPNDLDNEYSWGTKIEPVYNLSMTGVTGTFVAGETITIGGEAAVVTTGGTSSIAFNVPTGINFGNGSTVTGGTSGATGTVNTVLESFSGVDKSLKGQKNINDAFATEIKAIKGVRFWWMDAPSLGGMKSEIASVIAPTTSSAAIFWDGSNLRITDGSLTPSDSDVVAAIRMLASTANLQLTRQDDGKEVATILLSDVPDSGSLGLTIGAHSLSIAWNDSTATIQSDWNASGAYAATISGSAANKKIVITANAAGLQASHVTLGANTLKKVSVTVTPTLSVKQGMASDGSISIPDGSFLFVQLPSPLANQTYDGVGTASGNYQVLARGNLAITDQSYWIAYREGSKLIWRGGLELNAGEDSSIGDTIPQSLLDSIGLASETSVPAYSSDIRGIANESIIAREGTLTDAIGDEQEDRSGYFRSDNQVTWTGTQLQFTTDIVLEFLNTKNGTTTKHTILAANSPISLNNGDIIYVQIDRTQTTENVTPVNSSVTPIPAQTQNTKDIIVLAKRVDASGAGYLHIPFHKQVLESGQTVRLGASGSGSGTGSGTGDDLDSLKFNASFGIDSFTDLPTSSKSAVDTGNTTALYDTANKVYRMSYDASKTVTGTGTSMHLSAAPAYTVAPGDILIVGTQAKRITAIGTINSDGGATTPFTIESAFTADPSASAACVSQVFTTTDLRAHTEASTGLSIGAVISDPVSTYMLRYEDSFSSGDAVWDYPGSPFAAFSVSADGSNWTSVQTRPMSITSSNEPIRTVAASGSEFIARFFSSATSGSGAFNLIKYKTFMHYAASNIAPTYANTAIARTDNSGSSVNCSVSSSTGKTRITTTFAFGSVTTVHMDGKKIPQFVDSTTTPGAYYTKISANVIELDADYSALGLQLEVTIPSNTVDNTDANAGYISAIQDTGTAAAQGFVDESVQLTAVNGTPGIGQFRSSVVNRASIPDLSNNLEARMGIKRISTQLLMAIPNEFGQNGEAVFGVVNDDRGTIRFIGNADSQNDSYGPRCRLTGTASYAEITFFGTGLNLLTLTDSAQDMRATIDNGVEGSNLIPSTGSTIQGARNTAALSIINVATGLSQGLHTIKIRNNTSGSSTIYGFEVANESSNVNVRPGTAYVGNKKLVNSAVSSVAYNSGFDAMYQAGGSVGSIGTRGARVKHYIKADGTIGKAAYLVNAAQATMSSADHTYEEPVRNYFFREFAAGRSDDLSAGIGNNQSKSFTLDDNNATMVLSSVNFYASGAVSNTNEVLQPTGTGSFIAITFIGTGLDLAIAGSSGSFDSHTISLDGTNLTTSFVGSTTSYTQKICSGLPYGTHTVKITRNANTNFGVSISGFTVYQPKKPAIPSGSVELADYCLLGAFSVANTASLDAISSGVIRKHALREFVYTGTWAINSGQTVYIGGFETASSTSGATASYTFFGTGFDMRGNSNTALTSGSVVTIDGSNATVANFPGLTSSAWGAWSYNNSTAVLAQNLATGTAGSGFSISGLPLGLHTVKITTNSIAALVVETIDVITPIHSYKFNGPYCVQNTIAIGNHGISDTRKITPTKDIVPATKAMAQATAVNVNPSTTSTNSIPMPDMNCTLKTGSGFIEVGFGAQVQPTGGTARFSLYVDGVFTGGSYGVNSTATSVHNIPPTKIPVGAGVHNVQVYWLDDNGSTLNNNGARQMTVREL